MAQTKTEAAKIVADVAHRMAQARFDLTDETFIFAQPFIEAAISTARDKQLIEAVPGWVTVAIQMGREVVKRRGSWVILKDRVLDLADEAAGCDGCGNVTRTFIVDMIPIPPKRWCSDCYDFDTGTVKEGILT